jgi:LAO/AO transport system kinase
MNETSRSRVEDLLAGLGAGDRSAISEALNLVDDRRSEPREAALALLDGLATAPLRPDSYRIGITGAPGAGKSSLLNALVEGLGEDAGEIGIIAVDPSSRRSGGALLGDRMRLSAAARERGVFLRSMAARERLGGLADATHASVAILCAVFDRVFIETVGVGQSECEVAELVDSLIFVAQPGAGDTLQFMKAGILELPDIFVVNKADTGPVADRTQRELASTLGASTGHDDWRAPVLKTSARDRTGLDSLIAEIARHREYNLESGEFKRRRARGEAAFAIESLLRRYGEHGLEQIGGIETISRRLESGGKESAFGIVLALGREIEAAIRRP